jgi:hypothetical protein
VLTRINATTWWLAYGVSATFIQPLPPGPCLSPPYPCCVPIGDFFTGTTTTENCDESASFGNLYTPEIASAGYSGTATINPEDCDWTDNCLDCCEVTAEYLNGDTVWFCAERNFAAGDYIVEYVRGAMTYSDGSVGAAQGFRVNDGAFAYSVLYNDGLNAVNAPGTTTEFGTQAAVEAASAGSSATFTHTGGKIGIVLGDDPYGDNALDLADPSPSAPRFRLCPDI